MEERKGKQEVMCGTLDLSALPLGCITLIISFTSPRDACRLSLVSTAFNSAAESDAVWGSFLPSQYQALIPSSLSFSSKKQLYLSLCENPLLIEAGRKSFWLERMSGKKCYMLSSRDLSIIGSDPPEYRRWISTRGARFDEVAYIRRFRWFEIRGRISISMLSPMTHYKAYLVCKVRNFCGLQFFPVKLSVGVVGTEGSKRSAYLQPKKERRRWPYWQIGEEQPIPGDDVQFPKARVDGWLEVEMGEFFNEACVDDGELEMSALEIEGGIVKGDLIFQGIEIRSVTPNLCDSNLGLDSLSTAELDTAWESLLPCQYQDLIPTLDSFSSKKDIYLSLGGNPVRIEGGRKSFWLDRVSGKKCYMLSSRDFSIIRSGPPGYRRWISTRGARFDEVAVLLHVCWFEIRGRISISMLSAMTHYKAYLVYKVRNVYGFQFYPVKLNVGVVGTEGSKRVAYLLPRGRPPNDVQFPKARVDRWLEVEMGEFFNEECVDDGELEMSALEMEGCNRKGDLILQGIEIRAITPN
ncbi:F-box protein PP2-B10 isoform X1 [Gossypium hirsutum]|uniref:F-box protein PP2-B10 isoform X1 n=1 Tax=Gossypium hirsutum TaxID=3635 RepID=A0A1U8PLQ4_GOSHI|nr:F-box protein PP2-B10 isoform X1 [Gossypium hirsutum]